jgi:anti-sigma regulatory factor (Ser/Thr protein kinase)
MPAEFVLRGRPTMLSNRTDHSIAVHSRVFQAVPEDLAAVRAFLRVRWPMAGTGDHADDVLLAVSEACANAVLHSGSPTFRVGWQQRGGRVEIRIRDEGRFERAVPGGDRPGGNGIPVMTAVMDEITVRRGTRRKPGTEVRLVKHLEAAEPRRAVRLRSRRSLVRR